MRPSWTMGAELAPAPVALAADVTAAATFTCVTGPLSPGLPIRTLTLTLVGEACTAVATAGAAVVAVVAIPAAVSDETGVVSGSAGAWTGAVSDGGTVSTGVAALGASVDVASAGAACSVARAAAPSASPIASSTAALASPASTAPVSSDGAVTGADGTEAGPSSARASVGRVAAAALTRVAATTHVARRAVVIGAMQRHLCNLLRTFYSSFANCFLDTAFIGMYFLPYKRRWIWWGIGGITVRDSVDARRRRFSPPTTREATDPPERG